MTKKERNGTPKRCPTKSFRHQPFSNASVNLRQMPKAVTRRVVQISENLLPQAVDFTAIQLSTFAIASQPKAFAFQVEHFPLPSDLPASRR